MRERAVLQDGNHLKVKAKVFNTVKGIHAREESITYQSVGRGGGGERRCEPIAS